MDPVSTKWFVQWLNRCSPDYLHNRDASGPRSGNVISALRWDHNYAFDHLRRSSDASTPSER